MENEKNIMDLVPNLIDCLTIKEASLMNPLALAFVGDAVHTLFSRTVVVKNTDSKINKLHKMVSDEINATAQSNFISNKLDILTEEELSIFKRARNSKIHTAAKNAEIIDYKKATGFEAVLGFLYLTGQHERLFEILHMDADLEGDL